jgi:hypothetical protein
MNALLCISMAPFFATNEAYGIMEKMVSNTKKPRPRTYARNRAVVSRRGRLLLSEPDGVYFFKLVLVVLLSTLWIKLATPLSWQGIPIAAFPLGALIVLVAIRLLEKNPLDRKIWFAVLLVVTIISYFVPAGIVI